MPALQARERLSRDISGIHADTLYELWLQAYDDEDGAQQARCDLMESRMMAGLNPDTGASQNI